MKHATIMLMNHKDWQEFRGIKVVIVLVAVIVVLVAGWHAWQRTRAQTSIEINSFETCVEAGYPVMEIYPEQCAANGKTFTNLSQMQNPTQP